MCEAADIVFYLLHVELSYVVDRGVVKIKETQVGVVVAVEGARSSGERTLMIM